MKKFLLFVFMAIAGVSGVANAQQHALFKEADQAAGETAEKNCRARGVLTRQCIQAALPTFVSAAWTRSAIREK